MRFSERLRYDVAWHVWHIWLVWLVLLVLLVLLCVHSVLHGPLMGFLFLDFDGNINLVHTLWFDFCGADAAHTTYMYTVRACRRCESSAKDSLTYRIPTDVFFWGSGLGLEAVFS